jgi:hypothetical protein
MVELGWVYGDGVNIGHGDGGDIVGVVMRNGKTAPFTYKVDQLPFQGNYAVDTSTLERKIADAVGKVA